MRGANKRIEARPIDAREPTEELRPLRACPARSHNNIFTIFEQYWEREEKRGSALRKYLGEFLARHVKNFVGG